MKTITLTEEECKAVHELISSLSGGNPEYCFLAFVTGEVDNPTDPGNRACAKIYECAGAQVPDNLKGLT